MPTASEEMTIAEPSATVRALVEQIARDVELAGPRRPAVAVTSEPRTYTEHSRHSFFLDMARAATGRDEEAEHRLAQHQIEARVEGDLEARAPLGITNTTQGSEFTVPGWLIAKFGTASAAGRVLGDLVPNLPLPAGVSSVRIPRITTNMGVDVQQEQLAVPSTDAVTTDASQTPVVTIAGENDVSQQLYDQTPIGFDAVAYVTLTRAYNAKLETQMQTGSGSNGQLLGVQNVSGRNSDVNGASMTTIATLWPGIGQICASVSNNRKLRPEVLVMAGRRWFWIASSVDGSQRPIASPASTAEPSTFDVAGTERPVGKIDGLPVYTSGGITAGSSADQIVACRPSDMLLFESAPKYRAVVEQGSGTLQVRVQLYRYVAFIPQMYANGITVLTGLTQPSNF